VVMVVTAVATPRIMVPMHLGPHSSTPGKALSLCGRVLGASGSRHRDNLIYVGMQALNKSKVYLAESTLHIRFLNFSHIVTM
jgi:hypothetical protein